eukprot:m.25198 g.25198  ORF g.25198 m.25198 type:complete len:143 (-) comp14912_c0_seq1:120-548(-)
MTICPYKIVLLCITVIFAALAAWYGSDFSNDNTLKKQPMRRQLRKRQKKENADSDDSEFETEDEIDDTIVDDDINDGGRFSKLGNLWSALKAQHPAAYNTCYIVCISLLVILHFEIFSGGYVCKQLFANKSSVENISDAIPA